MELCFLKSTALDTLKDSLPDIFENYLVEKDNSWVKEIYGENPFVKFKDVPDFELAPFDEGLDMGEVDFRNSKILYDNLRFLTPRQAADERFWAGLCHGTFYDYVRRRCNYNGLNNLSAKKNITEIKNRFFFNGGSRERILKNTLSKCWWAGYIFPGEELDILGAKDFYTKVFSIMTRSFIGSEIIRAGFVKFLRHFKAQGIILDAKKHIRPAMSELNKRGGAIILDCLTKEEIAAIMIEYVEKIFAAKSPPELVRKPDRFVKDGDKVYATSLIDGLTKTFRAAKKYPVLYRELRGKTVDDVFELKGKQWKITAIKQV